MTPRQRAIEAAAKALHHWYEHDGHRAFICVPINCIGVADEERRGATEITDAILSAGAVRAVPTSRTGGRMTPSDLWRHMEVCGG